jgi:hypothetical protein
MYFIYCTSSTPSFILWGSHIALAIRGYKWVYHSIARKLPTCMAYIYLLLFVFSYPVLSCLILSVPSPFCFILSCLDWSVYPSTFYLYVYLSVCLFVCLSVCLCVYLSIYLLIDLSFYLIIQSSPIQSNPVQSNPIHHLSIKLIVPACEPIFANSAFGFSTHSGVFAKSGSL